MSFKILNTLMICFLVVLLSDSRLQKDSTFLVEQKSVEFVEDIEPISNNLFLVLLNFWDSILVKVYPHQINAKNFDEIKNTYSCFYQFSHSGIDPPKYI